jgi:hypothetical protein
MTIVEPLEQQQTEEEDIVEFTEQLPKERKPRAEKRIVEITDRDKRAIKWIGEQYAVRFDTVQKLLGREPKNTNDFVPVNGVLSARNTRHAIGRWVTEGLVVQKKFLFEDPGWLWLTNRGLHAVQLNYCLYLPSLGNLNHLHHLNELRITLENRYKERLTWKSERELRQAFERMSRDHKKDWHIVDAVITVDGGPEVGIEVELTQKSERRHTELVERLSRQYKGVWYFVTDDTKNAVERAIDKRRHIFRVYNFAEVLK